MSESSITSRRDGTIPQNPYAVGLMWVIGGAFIAAIVIVVGARPREFDGWDTPLLFVAFGLTCVGVIAAAALLAVAAIIHALRLRDR